MQQGTVIWFNNARGYEFLSRDDGEKELFVHYSAITADGYKKLNEGQRVEFEVVKGEKGIQADSVTVIG
jgi:CspA family cold shock protein